MFSLFTKRISFAVPFAIEPTVQNNVNNRICDCIYSIERTVSLLCGNKVNCMSQKRQKLSYLKDSEVSLPPEILSDPGPENGKSIVAVH